MNREDFENVDKGSYVKLYSIDRFTTNPNALYITVEKRNIPSCDYKHYANGRPQKVVDILHGIGRSNGMFQLEHCDQWYPSEVISELVSFTPLPNGTKVRVPSFQELVDKFGVTQDKWQDCNVNGIKHTKNLKWDAIGSIVTHSHEIKSSPLSLCYKVAFGNDISFWYNFEVLSVVTSSEQENPVKLLQIDNTCATKELLAIIKKHSRTWDDLEMELCSWEEAKKIACRTGDSFSYNNVYYYKDNEWGKTLKVSRDTSHDYRGAYEVVEEYTTGHAYVYHINFIKKLIVRCPGGKVITYIPQKETVSTQRTAETIEYTEYFKAMLSKIPVNKIIIARFKEPHAIRNLPGVEFAGPYVFTYEGGIYGTRDYPWGTDCQILYLANNDYVKCVKDNNKNYHIDFIEGFSVFNGPDNSPAEKTYKRNDYPYYPPVYSKGKLTVELPQTADFIEFKVEIKENKMKKEDIAKLKIDEKNLTAAAKEVKAQRDRKDQETAKEYLTKLLSEEDQLVAEKARIDLRLQEVQEMIKSLGYPPKE